MSEESSEGKDTLKIIDGTLEAVEKIFNQFTDVLRTARKELMELEKDREKLSKETKYLESAKSQLEESKNKLETEKMELEQEKNHLEKDKNQLEEETKKLEKEKKERDMKIGSMTEEQERLLKEYESLKVDLKKLAKIAEESQEAEFNFERIKALLSIYAVLIDEIWQGQPHYRILLALHGDKEEMSRDSIQKTTGISGVMVLRAIHELTNVGLLDFDENSGMLRLKKRLFDKKDLEHKDSKKN